MAKRLTESDKSDIRRRLRQRGALPSTVRETYQRKGFDTSDLDLFFVSQIIAMPSGPSSYDSPSYGPSSYDCPSYDSGSSSSSDCSSVGGD